MYSTVEHDLNELHRAQLMQNAAHQRLVDQVRTPTNKRAPIMIALHAIRRAIKSAFDQFSDSVTNFEPNPLR